MRRNDFTMTDIRICGTCLDSNRVFAAGQLRPGFLSRLRFYCQQALEQVRPDALLALGRHLASKPGRSIEHYVSVAVSSWQPTRPAPQIRI